MSFGLSPGHTDLVLIVPCDKEQGFINETPRRMSGVLFHLIQFLGREHGR